MAPRRGTRRACDACSVRKVRCDGNQPCSRCEAANWDCTFLKTHGKSGPKGPRRTTEAAIRRLQERSRSTLSHSRSESETEYDDGSPSTSDHHFVEQIPPTSEPEPDRLGWPDAAGPVFPNALREHQRISTSCISQYLEVYQLRGYGIWPVVDGEALVARLLMHPDDLEAYALASAICAATISQFRIDAEPGSPVEGHYRVSSACFEAEAQRARQEVDHMEHVTLSSLLSSFFLHVYSANIGRMGASTLYLGETITKAHMLGLYKLSYYQSMSIEQQQHNLRIYWLLFITERAHSIQHDVPTMLKRAPELPPLEDLGNDSVPPAFIQLCRLFSILDATLSADPATARNALAVAQKQLNEDESIRSLGNELQRADITMTQQWMRIFLWQHALGVTSLKGINEDDEFSFSFPAKVAQNVLENLNSLSRASIEAHGPGMESKLFDVANSLADVMICVPALNQQSNFGVGPRDLIHSLSALLGSFRGGNPAVISILQDKLNTLGLAISSPELKIELSSPTEEEPQERNESSRYLTWSDSESYNTDTTMSPVFPPALNMAL